MAGAYGPPPTFGRLCHAPRRALPGRMLMRWLGGSVPPKAPQVDPDEALDVVGERVGVLKHVVGRERKVLARDMRGLDRVGRGGGDADEQGVLPQRDRLRAQALLPAAKHGGVARDV